MHHTLSLGIERRYALAKNGFLNIQHCVRGPTTLSAPRLQDTRLKNLDEKGVFLRRGTSHKRYRLATMILVRHRPHLKRTINMELHLQPTTSAKRWPASDPVVLRPDSPSLDPASFASCASCTNMPHLVASGASGDPCLHWVLSGHIQPSNPTS